MKRIGSLVVGAFLLAVVLIMTLTPPQSGWGGVQAILGLSTIGALFVWLFMDGFFDLIELRKSEKA